MSQLDTDVVALTGKVATLEALVGQAVTALQNIASESTDDAAVVAANTALDGMATSLSTALSPPTSPAPTPAPAV